jgi:DNA-nicking Smr family endonuclease
MARRGGGRITEADLEAWRHAMRHAEPLPGRALPPRRANDAAPDSKLETAAALPEVVTPAAPPAGSLPDARPVVLAGRRHEHEPGIDRRSQVRLKRGLYPIEARLDLHGLTQAEAHARLDAFLGTAHRAGRRCVLVITGKGLRPLEEERGVLRRAIPHWLDQPPNRGRVLAYAAARPQHGGSGALYVLLRRGRRER